jgi:hypothetical protein
MNIKELLKQQESEWLDFKAEFHTNTVKLLHDILCLCNSYSENNRCLVFGVRNDKSICGIENDPNKKTNADIQDFIRQAKLNRLPTINLKFYKIKRHEVAMLEISNRPEKPFFTIQDFAKNKDVVRAGVIYTRLGDTNIPLRETASEYQIELMWRERFGIGLDPFTRFEKLLEEKEKWIAMGEHQRLYHKLFPEFTIIESGICTENFKESWSEQFPDSHATSYYLEIRYHTTVLQIFTFVSCDGGRYFLPLPQRNKDGSFSINPNSIEYKIAELYRQYFPIDSAFEGVGVKILRQNML